MPGLPEETSSVLAWIAKELGPKTYVNVMGQYRPGGKVCNRYRPELNRPLDVSELRAALRAAGEVGLDRLDPRSRP